MLQQFSSLYGTPFLDSIDVEFITPSIKVASTPSRGFPDFSFLNGRAWFENKCSESLVVRINVIIAMPLDISLEIVPKVIRGETKTADLSEA